MKNHKGGFVIFFQTSWIFLCQNYTFYYFRHPIKQFKTSYKINLPKNMSLYHNISLIFVVLMLAHSTFATSSELTSVTCRSSRPITCDNDEYQPVCAYRNIQCLVAPCNNYETFSNVCQACVDSTVTSYTNEVYL